MAKKTLSPTEMSVEDRLKALYQLQQTLTAIDEKRALRGELPLEVQDLEDELEGLNTRIEKIMAEIQELETAMSEKKIAIEEEQTKENTGSLDTPYDPTLDLAHYEYPPFDLLVDYQNASSDEEEENCSTVRLFDCSNARMSDG